MASLAFAAAALLLFGSARAAAWLAKSASVVTTSTRARASPSPVAAPPPGGRGRPVSILEQDLPESGKRLVYLDSAASSQKPSAVIDAHGGGYRHDNANVHRGVHYLSGKATDAYEAARVKVANFVNARSDREIVFQERLGDQLSWRTRGASPTSEATRWWCPCWSTTAILPGLCARRRARRSTSSFVRTAAGST